MFSPSGPPECANTHDADARYDAAKLASDAFHVRLTAECSTRYSFDVDRMAAVNEGYAVYCGTVDTAAGPTVMVLAACAAHCGRMLSRARTARRVVVEMGPLRSEKGADKYMRLMLLCSQQTVQ